MSIASSGTGGAEHAPLRVLVVTQYFWPENFRINELVAELVRRGNSITVLTGRPNYPDGRVFAEYRASPAAFASYAGAKVVRVPMLARGQGSLRLLLNYLVFACVAAIWGPWRLRRRPFDVVFVFEPSPVTVGIPAVVLGRLKRAPVLFWILDQWPETLQAVGVVRSRWLIALLGRMVSFIYNRCEVLLAQSKSMVGIAARYVRDPARVEYFPNWADRMPDIHSVEPAAELPPKSNCFDVMFAGNIGESQDFGAILSAAELLRDETNIRWLIVGDGRMADWVRTEITRRDLTGRVLMLGRHPADRMASFYRNADALLVALRAEPIFAFTVPGKLPSYLAAGLPILGMLDGEGGRIIEESGAGFACAAGDFAALARAVRSMVSLSAGERAGMSERGRAYALREFDRDRLIDQLEMRMRRAVRR
jgi:glycosyltransferase involved in cell wall biosynthesis